MNINSIDLKQLRYFQAVAEELSFSRAAERLNMSQPPLSAQIKNLEHSLNTILFERTKRSVKLTEAGICLLAETRRLYTQLEAALLTTQAAGRGDFGELRIGTNFSSLFFEGFAGLIAAYHRAYPNVKLTFHEMLLDESIAQLRDHRIDIAFTWPDRIQNRGSVHFKPLAHIPMKLCVAVHHRLAKKKTITLDDLRDELLILSPRQNRTGFYHTVHELAIKRGFQLKVYQETVIFPIIANMVAAGYGVAFLPEFLKNIVPGTIVCKSFQGVKERDSLLPIALAYNAERLTPKIDNFLKLMKTVR